MSCGVLGQRQPFSPFFLLRVVLIPCGIDKALLVVLGSLVCSQCIVCLVIDVVMILYSSVQSPFVLFPLLGKTEFQAL